MSKGWDNATLKKLKALTGKGLSTSEIGKRLGLTKNAVVGKLNRLGWNAKADATAPAAKATAVKKTATKPAAKKATPAKTTKTPAKPAAKAVKPAPAKKTVAPKKESTPKATTAPKKAPAKSSPTKEVKAPVTAKKAPAAAPKEKTTDKATLNKNLAMHQRIIQHSLEMANLKPNQCRWPIGDPDSEHFHFCGETVFTGKPYCYEHCKQAYQFTPPKKK